MHVSKYDIYYVNFFFWSRFFLLITMLMRLSFLKMDLKLIAFLFVMLLKYALFVDSKKKPAKTK